jgi:hypothetical protein
VTIEDDQRSWELLADHQFNLDRHALLGPESSGFQEVQDASPIVGEVALTRVSAEVFEVTVQSDGDTLLVISETWLPGWEAIHATCDGGPCPAVDDVDRVYFAPMRANLTLLAVWVPSGNSSFVLRYNPLSVRAGLWISGISLLILFAFLLWRGRTRGMRW